MRRLSLAIAWLLVVLIQATWADQVIPRDRVTTQLNVRYEPKSSAAVVGAPPLGEATKWIGDFMGLTGPGIAA